MATMKQKSKVGGKKVAAAVAAAIFGLFTIGSIITLFVKVDRQTDSTVIGGESYSIGILDDEGKKAEGDTSIYMRKAITTDGLKCELAEDATIKYQLFFYDKDEKFISASAELTKDYNGEGLPEDAESVKIVITPTEDEDGKVSLVEVLGYAAQLKVTVDK